MKKNTGITLIALVVTIIVLIILAGVSINLVLGDNGIIERAKTAKTETEEAQKEEQEGLNILTNYIDNQGKVIIEGPVAGESYDKPYIPAGFTHTEGEGSWNSGYVIKDELGNEFVWVPCVLEENRDDIKDGDTVTTFGRTLPETTATTDPYYMYNKNNVKITGEENPASAIRTSVGTYGGFYIAAYEAGIEGIVENNRLSEKTATDGSVKPLSQPGKGLWNRITRENAIIVAASMINTEDGVKSGLISGEAWDTTLQWMVNTSDNALENSGYDIDSTGKGWYYDLTSSLGVKQTAGYYAVNNIYDMAGNLYEYTTENCTYNGTNFRVRRGGARYDTGASNFPAAHRSYNDLAQEYIGFRVVLYK